METRILLQSLENRIDNNKDLFKNYFKEYSHDHLILKPNRDGIFFCLFNKMFDSALEKTPHIALSKFELFKNHADYFRIKNHQEFELSEKKTCIVLFNIDPLETSLELLSDFLKWFNDSYLLRFPNLNIIANYDYKLDISNPVAQKYLLSYFQLIQKEWGEIPELISLIDLEKRASFDNYLIVEAIAQWSCLDNYLVHVVLAKGGHLLQPDLDVTKFQIISEQQLSPYHSIQKIKKLQRGDFDISCHFLEDLSCHDFFKHPEDLKLFYYLMYENVFTVVET